MKTVEYEGKGKLIGKKENMEVEMTTAEVEGQLFSKIKGSVRQFWSQRIKTCYLKNHKSGSRVFSRQTFRPSFGCFLKKALFQEWHCNTGE